MNFCKANEKNPPPSPSPEIMSSKAFITNVLSLIYQQRKILDFTIIIHCIAIKKDKVKQASIIKLVILNLLHFWRLC